MRRLHTPIVGLLLVILLHPSACHAQPAALDQEAEASSTHETTAPPPASIPLLTVQSSAQPPSSSAAAQPPLIERRKIPRLSASYSTVSTNHRPNPGATISAHLNSLHSNQDGPHKSGALISASMPAYLRPYSTLPKSALQELARHYSQLQQQHQPSAGHLHANLGEQLPGSAGVSQSSLFSGQTNGVQAAQGGYILSVNTNNGETLTSSGPTSVLMQYLPQSQPTTGGIQYLQLIPTRPLIVPISSFLPQLPQPQAQQQLQQQQPQQSHLSALPQHMHYSSMRGPHAKSIASHPQPYAMYAAAQNYLQAGQLYAQAQSAGLVQSANPPQSQPQPLQSTQPASQPASAASATAASSQYPLYQSPVAYTPAASSAAPAVQFFRPHTGIQLVNGPIDMSLNTNEYIPVQSESAYKVRRA